jgi:uncharacterized protein (DUF58 family)
MGGLARALTTRGRCFIAAGAVGALCGLVIPEPDLLRIGVLLMILPLLSAFGASRARYRLSCSRRAEPARVQAGQPASITLQLSNATRLRTGLLLAEDTLPRQLGRPPRFVLDGLRGGGSRTLRYQVPTSDRGKYTVGPLQVRVADSFGLIAITRSFAAVSTLTVTPRIIPLPQPPAGGTWLGDSERGQRSIAAGGEDDVAPRQYQVGDGLRRVHWRSTARYGELMVRREEQHWRNTASLFLDTRRAAFGSGPVFELAVMAAASVGVQLAGQGVDARLVTDAGEIPRQMTFRDTLLETLAVLRPAHSAGLGAGVEALSAAGGQIIAVLGALTAEHARQIAGARRGTAPALALLLGGLTEPTAGILTAAGWRVATADSEESLAAAWRELHGGGAGGRGFAVGRGFAGDDGADDGGEQNRELVDG